MTSETPAVKLDKVNVKLGRGASQVHVLKDITLAVPHGQAVSFVGPSGSGKSTLLATLSGLEAPTTGEVAINGTSIVGLDEDALAQFRRGRIGIVFQSFHLIPNMTALENIAVPLELMGDGAAISKAKAQLEKVGLADRANHFPAQLSGGEQQRIALARALAPEPDLLIADEPTGNLDGNTGGLIVDLIFKAHQENRNTLVLVTHDMGLAEKCERIIRLKDGRIQSDSGGEIETAPIGEAAE